VSAASPGGRNAASPVANVRQVAPAPAISGAPPPSLGSSYATPDPQEILRRLKDATVYIKNKIGSRTVSSGSGFVIETSGDQVVVATNRHVAVFDPSDLPPAIAASGTKPTIEAVVRSGMGPQLEQALDAQIMAADLSEDLNVDLAFLVVRGVKNPPAPIDPSIPVQATEGMPYIGAGFPLGGLLSKVTESKGNPSVTITGGRVSALRRDAHGQLAVLQVDGSLQPGNSGGPIIDEKSGRLLGVAVAKVGSVDTIGFVVLAEEVRRALAGRFGSFDLTLEGTGHDGTANLLVKALLVDPRGQVGGVEVRAAQASAVGTFNPDSAGVWPPLPGSRPVELQRDARTQMATGRVQVALSGQSASARKILIQAASRDLRGRLVYAKPQEVLVPNQPGRIMATGTLERLIKSVRTKSLSLLGPLVDPSHDCRLDKDTSAFKVRLDIPGKLHTLSPELTARSRSQPLHNAPMTLTEVDGDFAVFVEVTGEISPGAQPPSDRQSRALPFTVQSAGLILYEDRKNFFRLERAGSILTQTLTPVHRLIIEAVKDGHQAMDPIYMDVPEGDVMLIIVKRKGRVRCMYSLDGGRSGGRFREFALNLPPKLKVGLCASNISAKPFTATFESFALLSDVTRLDQAFGE
jgi:S1-C subfamily serine protease